MVRGVEHEKGVGSRSSFLRGMRWDRSSGCRRRTASARCGRPQRGFLQLHGICWHRLRLGGDATNALIVVRTAHCEQTLVNGERSRAGTLSQIGISLVGPDTTADINNYTLWYTTTDPLLAAALLTKGIRAELDPSLRFVF